MRRTLSALFVTALAACTLAAHAGPMEDLARSLHDSDFSGRVEYLLKKNNPAQALELADLGLKRNTRNVQLRFMRTVALDQLGRREEAAKALEAIVRDYPELPDPYNNLAVIEAGFGNLERAAELLQKALNINPKFTLARKNLGDVHLALAVEAYEKAAPDMPKNRELQTRLTQLKRMTADGV